MRSNYKGRKFVIVKMENRKPDDETNIMLQALAARVLERDDFVEFKARLVRGRPGYRSQGGTDYAYREAGQCFAALKKGGWIRELKAA